MGGRLGGAPVARSFCGRAAPAGYSSARRAGTMAPPLRRRHDAVLLGVMLAGLMAAGLGPVHPPPAGADGSIPVAPYRYLHPPSTSVINAGPPLSAQHSYPL